MNTANNKSIYIILIVLHIAMAIIVYMVKSSARYFLLGAILYFFLKILTKTEMMMY